MTRTDLADMLASCLDSIEQGEHSLEECLALYPGHRNDLEALLRITASIRERADFTSRPGFRATSRARLLRRLSPRQPVAYRQRSGHAGHRAFHVSSRRLAVLRATLLVLAVFLTTGGTAYASGEALPGDVLYPLKLSIEDARLWISDDAGDVLLATRFMQARIDEIQALIDSDREEELPLAVNLLRERIDNSTESLEAVAQDDPERAAQFSIMLEETLSNHTEVLTSQLESVPDQAKPAIEQAIVVSSKGQDVVQKLFEDKLPGGGPPDGIPGPDSAQPGGGPPDEMPDPPSTQPGGAPPEGVPGSPSTQPGGGPTNGTAGPPNDVPGNRP